MTHERLLEAADRFGTPLYAYDLDGAAARARLLHDLFGGRFGVSYAIKANPNAALLKALQPHCATFDASSFAEVRRGIAAGMPAARISFSGPAKRRAEIEAAVDACVGELVVESLAEATAASARAEATGHRQPVVARINPLRLPRKFGASMAATPSQFGIDEEEMEATLPAIAALPGVELIGFHVYSGTNCLDAPAIAENFGIFLDIFRRAQALTGIAPRALIFGAGFGVPYLPGEAPLDHDALPALVNPMLDTLKAEAPFAGAALALELGRWIVGPCGWLLTRVVMAKRSRGVEIRACDAGFNNHLAACGMMGSVIRRNWIFSNLSNPAGERSRVTLVGPLCTTIDRLGADVDLPEVRVDDVIAIDSSGAYGLTSSPVKFISHPEPREAAWADRAWRDVSETLLNHWTLAAPGQAHAAPPGAPAAASAPSTPKRGFVILGFPRSGTTLLSRLLDAHPDVSSPPETYLDTAAARFLSEQRAVEGPPVGVLTGLGFLGFDAEAVMAPLRALIFEFHARIAGDAPVWVEKTAIDSFHVETLEPLLAGHVRFILITRNPLDVIASNLDLARTMGAQLDELFAATRGVNDPHEALARAWVDRTATLDAFAARHTADCHRLRYEDLVARPAEELDRLFAFMGVSGDPAAIVEEAFRRRPRVGLGDFRTHELDGVRPLDANAWRKRVPPGAAARILPLLAPLMRAHGYTVPAVPRPLEREEAIRQYAMAAMLKRDRARSAA